MNTGVTRVRTEANAILDQLERVIVGKRAVLERAVTALLCEGHVLLEDVPGVGKTVLARSLAATIGGTFQRIQFTPDLLPSDVTGSLVFDPRTSEFNYRPGPIVANVVLADEINRAGPRTQAALLEAMEERHVTVDRERKALPRPFFVIATQNPVEMDGTFPLPEAQLDRFLIRLSLGYPGRENELRMLERQHDAHPLESLQRAIAVDDLLAAQQVVRSVHVAPPTAAYIVSIVEATRRHESVQLGASPRGSLALYNTARAWAAMHGQNVVEPDEIKDLAVAALAHRVIVHPGARLRGVTGEAVIRDIIASTPVPGAIPRDQPLMRRR